MKKIDYIFICLACIIVSVFLPSNCRRGEEKTIVKTDTIVTEKHDTITIISPNPVKEIHYKTITDTLVTVDSVTVPVEVPISVKTYEGDTTTTNGTKVQYMANISGYRASLDSLWFGVDRNDTIIYKEITKYKKRHWFIGPSVGAGYGMFHKGVDVYIGVSAGYAF